MIMKPRALPLLMAGLMLLAPAAARAAVTDSVKKTVDEVVRIVSDKELKKPQNEKMRHKELKTTIETIFDYAEMAQRCMGSHWKDRSPAEKKEFVQLFETLLENSYVGKIESYNQEKIVYLKETVDGDNAEVKSKVVTAKRDEYTLDYRLLKKGGKWMVYDVVIEGVSLVANYRTQFDRIVRDKGYDELVLKLKSRSEEIKAPK